MASPPQVLRVAQRFLVATSAQQARESIEQAEKEYKRLARVSRSPALASLTSQSVWQDLDQPVREVFRKLLTSAQEIQRHTQAAYAVLDSIEPKSPALARYLEDSKRAIDQLSDLTQDPIRFSEQARTSFGGGPVYNSFQHLRDVPQAAIRNTRSATTVAQTR